MRQYHYTMEELMGEKEHPLFLVLEDLQDPGNMGDDFPDSGGSRGGRYLYEHQLCGYL